MPVKLRLNAPEERTCRTCQKPFLADWASKWHCDPCVHRVRFERERGTSSYRVPPAVREFILKRAVREAVEAHSLVILTGPTGTAKTTQAHLALAHLQGRSAFVAGGSLSFRPQWEEHADAPNLALDDVGRRITPAVCDTLCELLDRRGERRQTTICTTNLLPEHFEEIDPRLASRLAFGEWVPLVGVDLRRQEGVS